MARSYTHVLVTRLGIGVNSDLWFRRRFPIFRGACFPSIAAQTVPVERWIVSCDAGAPAWLDDEFAKLKKILPAIELQRLDPFRTGSLNPISKPNLRETVKTSHILTSRIDDDDCWRHDYVERLRHLVDGAPPAASDRLGLTLFQGYEYSTEDFCLREMLYPWHSMTVNVLSPMDPLITCYDNGHTRTAAALREAGYSLIEFTDTKPYWLYLRHAAADSAYKGLKATGAVVPAGAEAERVVKDAFAVDIAHLNALLTEDAPLPGVDLNHPLVKGFAAARKTTVITQLEAKQELLKAERALRQQGKTEEAKGMRKLFYGER